MYNFGRHVADYDAPEVQGFLLREPFNFAAAERAEGFVGRSGYDGEPGPKSWGQQVFPHYLAESGRESGPSSLSLWADIESLMAFSYSGVHAEALKNAHHWNTRNRWPPLVLWWVAAGHRPDWTEAVSRFDLLDRNGASPQAFTFKAPFTPGGEPAVIDRARVRKIAAINAPKQADLLAEVNRLAV